jgi:hypothetical protein
MTTGSVIDITQRLLKFLPSGWFPPNDPTTRLYALEYGFATAFATNYTQIQYVKQQTRLNSSTGAFVDLSSNDFFGLTLPRRAGELDAAFITRIEQAIFQDRNTRSAIISAVYNLTGFTPTIIETWYPHDTGGWSAGNLGFDVAGCWAAAKCDFNVYITMPAPQSVTNPTLAGWDGPASLAGWDSGLICWTGPSLGVTTTPGILSICAALERVRTAGIKYFVQFTGSITFRLDSSNLDSNAVLA